MGRKPRPNRDLLWDRNGSCRELCFLVFSVSVGSKYSNLSCEKGKLVARRGRKTTGLYRGGGRVAEQWRGLDSAPSHKARMGTEIVSYSQYLRRTPVGLLSRLPTSKRSKA